MAWTSYQLLLAGMMLVTGSINTLSAKWADGLKAMGCHGSPEHKFDHPFLQLQHPFCAVTVYTISMAEATLLLFFRPGLALAAGMFLGELSCLAAFYILVISDRRRPEPRLPPSQSFNPVVFLLPALCDMTGTSLMYVALNMTSASSFQMLRGAVIIFTGLLSVAFLGRKLLWSQWIGIMITIAGLVVVGLADLLSNESREESLSNVITGDLLIIMAQVIAAIQMVLEEKFVYKHDVHPLRAVGIEGFFGFVILSLLLIPMYYIPAPGFGKGERAVVEDSLDAFCQMGNHPLIIVALLGNISSIAFFNFAGISVTKEISATTRMVIDSMRTVVIWVVSLALRWETFHGLQILGFIILLVGGALYNGLHKQIMCKRESGESAETERLLDGTLINEAVDEDREAMKR